VNQHLGDISAVRLIFRLLEDDLNRPDNVTGSFLNCAEKDSLTFPHAIGYISPK
jgi:hypothetical protein